MFSSFILVGCCRTFSGRPLLYPSHLEPDGSEGLLICNLIGMVTGAATGPEISGLEGVKETGYA